MRCLAIAMMAVGAAGFSARPLTTPEPEPEEPPPATSPPPPMPLPAESPSPAPVVLSPPPSPSPVVSPSPADDDEDDDDDDNCGLTAGGEVPADGIFFNPAHGCLPPTGCNVTAGETFPGEGLYCAGGRPSAPGGPFEAFGPSEGLPDSHQHCAPHFPPGNEQAAGMADLWAEADADGDCVLNAAELKALLEHLTAPSFFGDILEEAAARREESADAFLSRMADDLITFADGSEVFQDTNWRDASATTPEALLAMDLTFDGAITPWEFISGLHKLRHTGSSAANGGENQCAYHFDDFEVSNEQGCWCGSECEPGDGPCDGSDLPGGGFALMWVASLPKLGSDRARFMDFCVNEAVAIDLWAPLMQVLGARGEGPDPRVDCSDEREFARVLRGFTLCGDCASPDNCLCARPRPPPPSAPPPLP